MRSSETSHPQRFDAPAHRGRSDARVGLSVPVIVALAALAVPRALVHDLDLAGSLVNTILAVGPPLIWIAVVLAAGVPRPLLTLLAIGVAYGVMLAVTHQLLWNEAYDGHPPRLGGNLADAAAWVHDVVSRVGAVASSFVTGSIVGLLSGLVAAAIARIRRRAPSG